MEPTTECPIHQPKDNQINTNTYVSVGILVTILSGFAVMMNTIYSSKSTLETNQIRFENKIDGVIFRVDKFEKNRETWSAQDMFKWAVHLQRDNPSMKVPEPDTSKVP